MVHTGNLPTGVVLNFVPESCAAAFVAWHFTGMFGTSEAHAESMGSTLKRYAKSLSAGRVVESAILRSHGLNGRGGGGEDGFLKLHLAEFVGVLLPTSSHLISETRENNGRNISRWVGVLEPWSD